MSDTGRAKLLIGFLCVTCLALIVAVVILAVKKSDDSSEVNTVCSTPQPRFATLSTSDIFRDLSKEEIVRVRDYVLNEASLNITEHSNASEYSNYVFLIELKNPDKDEAIAFLDGSSAKKPKKFARVVIFAGALSPPVIKEILVPVNNPNNYTSPDSNNLIPFNYRPDDGKVLAAFQKIIDSFTRNFTVIMLEDFQLNCNTSCVAYVPAGPVDQDNYSIWVRLHRPRQTVSVYPLPIELYIVANSEYKSTWTIGKVFYNNVMFDSIEQFTEAYKTGTLVRIVQPAPQGANLYNDLHRRGKVKPDSRKVEPTMYEPGGKRYTAEKNHVEYMGWSFDFRVRTSSGLQLFDIRFNNTRIIYELSVQEAAAFYGGFSPTQFFADYLDSAWGAGKTFGLVKGVDCPETATYLDVVAFVDSGRITKRRNAVCVFELNTGIPLRRHFDYFWYGGVMNTALVVRTIMTPYNYDYIFDYVFYQNGVIEVKVATTGYVIATYWSSKEERYSTRIQKDIAGPIHDHMFHYKVDVDVAGRNNSFEIIRSKVEKTTRLSPSGGYHYGRYYEREQKKTEKEAEYTYDFQKPSYLNFYNKKTTNKFGVHRGYRVQLNGITRQMYPSNWSYTRGIHWSFNQISVTKYKKNETRSSSIYNQQDLYNPIVDFSQFVKDNEDIDNEDLITWVTVGTMHLPHTEDIPVTTTVGNSAGFFLRPYNYFDEDPSVASRDTVVITASDKGSKVDRPERDRRFSCVPRDEPLSYFGGIQNL